MLCYHATRFIDAIYQRFAEELAGVIQCAAPRLPALVSQKRRSW